MGRLDRSVTVLGRPLPVVSVALMAFVTLTTIAASTSRQVADAFVLIPIAVWRGELWRLVSWPLIVPGGGLGLIFWLTLMFFVAADLARLWRAARLLRVVGGLALCTGALLVALGWAWRPLAFYPFLSAWALAEGLFVAWAYMHSDQTVRFQFVLPVPGRYLVPAAFAITALMALVDGITAYIPQFIAMTLMVMYMRSHGLETLRLRLRYKWLQLRLGRRKSAFRVIDRDEREPPRWMH